jgi:DNA-binding MarR family transcriptional regulator
VNGEVPRLDETFHAPARLGIMTLLLQWGEGAFPDLKRALGLTDGNLGAHIRVLEEAGYVKVDKRFEGRKPKTLVRITAPGRKAFDNYLAQLQHVIELAKS